VGSGGPGVRTHFINKITSAYELAGGTSSWLWQQRSWLDGINHTLLGWNEHYSDEWETLKLWHDAGKFIFRYFMLHNYPFSAWSMGTGPGTAHPDYWRNWYRARFQFVTSGAGAASRYRMLWTNPSPDRVACWFAFWASLGSPYNFYELAELVPFHLFSNAECDELADKVLFYTKDPSGSLGQYPMPNACTFIDNCYLNVRDWFLPTADTLSGSLGVLPQHSAHGTTSETSPYLNSVLTSNFTTFETDTTYDAASSNYPGVAWSDHAEKYVRITDRIANQMTGHVNGQDCYRVANLVYDPWYGLTHADPIYIENARRSTAREWSAAQTAYRRDPRNVISAKLTGAPGTGTATQSMADAIEIMEEWISTPGGWLSCTYMDEAVPEQVEWFYQQAVIYRAQVSP
jgi:hypothetical protein